MTNEQRKMYFAEWRKCWVAIVKASGGQTTADETEVRHAVTFKALGCRKSSSGFNNSDFDRVMAVVWALAQADNFWLQKRQIDQPITRSEASVYAQIYFDDIRKASEAKGDHELVQRISTPEGRERYLGGICRRIHKCELLELHEADWPDVLGALNHTRLHKLGIAHSHPRSPWQKGHRSAGQKMASADFAELTPSTETQSRTGGDPAYVPPKDQPF